MKLNEICEVYSGYALKSFNDEEDGFPVIKIGNILIDGTLNLDECQYTTDSVNEKYYSNKGDIYIALSGATTGKIGIMDADERYVVNQRVGIVRKKSDKISQEYIKYFLLRQTDRILQEAAGCAQPNISPKQIAEYSVPEISKDKMFEVCSVLDKTKRIIHMRKTELTALDNLIKARFVEMFGEPIANSKGWPVKTLKELSTLITNGNTPKGGSENYVDSGIIFLRSQNIWRNRIELNDVAYIDEDTHASMKKSSLHHKDILITKTGRINTENSSLGRAALFLGEDDSANINGHVYLVRLTDEVVPEYVVTILTGEAYRKYIRKVCVGGIDKRQINVDQVAGFPIIMPPIERQCEFAEFRIQVDKSKVAVQKALDETQVLFDSLMQKYFG